MTGRTESVVHQLRPQDGLYGVLQKGVGETSLRIIGSLRDVAWPGRDSVRVLDAMASPTTHIASLTITEKGYLRAPDGGIDLALPAVKHDLALIGNELRGEAAAESSQTAIGLLVRGLARRYRLGGQPITVLSCDNVVHNGVMVKQVVLSLARAAGETASGWLEWLEQAVAYPSTMVDRITPAATPGDHAEAFALLGLSDEALVVAEPFSQWVVEDRFAGPRPAWEKAGVILTSDVDPYERAKLRILNGTHSLLAYVGVLSGFETIADAVNDPELRNTARRILDEDILPTLETPAGFDLTQYRDEVLARFANPALAHTTRQVAMDGSQKLPNRILGTAVDRLAAGRVAERPRLRRGRVDPLRRLDPRARRAGARRSARRPASRGGRLPGRARLGPRRSDRAGLRAGRHLPPPASRVGCLQGRRRLAASRRAQPRRRAPPIERIELCRKLRTSRSST